MGNPSRPKMSLKILTCALLVAAAVAHDFKTCGSDKLGVKTVTVDPDSPIPGKPLEVTFTGTPTQDIVDGDSLTITVKVFGIALGHVDFDICKDVGLTCPVKAGTASTWKATYNIPSAAPGGVPLTAEFTAQTAAKAQYSCLDVDVVMGKPPALSFAELAMHAQGPSCAHFEDRHDEDHRKCYEACGLGDFKVTGLNATGPCPDDYTQLDSTKTVEACNDGVTNLKYCKGKTLKPVSLRESTKGIKGMCYHKDSGNKCYEGCAMTAFKMTGLSEDGACDQSFAVVEKTFYSMSCSAGTTNTKYCFHPLYLVNVTMKTKGKGVALSAPNGDGTLYKVSGDECGRATLDSKYASYAEKFAGLTEGSCTAQGYTVADGTQTLKVPVLGDITIAKFKKATVTELEGEKCCTDCVAPEVKYFSVDVPHGFCGETCIKPSQYFIFHLFEKNLTIATDNTPCMEQFTPTGGHYTNYTSTVTHGVPGLKVTLDLYGPV